MLLLDEQRMLKLSTTLTYDVCPVRCCSYYGGVSFAVRDLQQNKTVNSFYFWRLLSLL